MDTSFRLMASAAVLALAMPGPVVAQTTAGDASQALSPEDEADLICILTTYPRQARALERMAFFFGRYSARNPGINFTQALNRAMDSFGRLSRDQQNAKSGDCQEIFARAFGENGSEGSAR
jgi:hypothetical protein